MIGTPENQPFFDFMGQQAGKAPKPKNKKREINPTRDGEPTYYKHRVDQEDQGGQKPEQDRGDENKHHGQ